MRKVAVLPVLVALAASGCQTWPGSGESRPNGNGDAASSRTSAIYAAVIRKLVTKDHTYGRGPSPFKRVFVLDGVVGNAANPLRRKESPSKPLPSAVKHEILEALSDLPPDLQPVRFVRNPDTVIVGEKSCARVRRGGVLISLGSIAEARGERVTVANSLFIACLGGQWLTYVLEPKDGGWRVAGTTGPIAIS